MDKQYIVVNKDNGLIGAPAHSIDAALNAINTAVLNSKKPGTHQGPFKIFELVELIEIEKVAINLKRTPIQQPEAGYQPEGFAALKNGGDNSYGHGSSNAADAGPSGFGKDFGTSLE